MIQSEYQYEKKIQLIYSVYNDLIINIIIIMLIIIIIK